MLFGPADRTSSRQARAPGLRAHATFKVANALIGLEVGSLNDELEVFRWDGKPKPVGLWERDHDLGSGMAYSVVWMFQEIARRTGRERMREWLGRLEYGNRDTSGGIDLFWLRAGARFGDGAVAYPIDGRADRATRARKDWCATRSWWKDFGIYHY